MEGIEAVGSLPTNMYSILEPSLQENLAEGTVARLGEVKDQRGVKQKWGPVLVEK
jgi:hypothetical protein